MACDDAVVEGFDISKSEIQDTLNKRYGQTPSIKTIKGLAENEVGYMSVIKHIELEWSDKKPEFPDSVIIKITCGDKAGEAINNNKKDGEHMDEGYMQFVQKVLHNNEVGFLKLFNRDDRTTHLYPEVYLAQDTSAATPYILMRDYNDCSLVDLIEGFNEKQLYAIVDQIVELQRYSITTEDWKDIEKPPEFYQMGENFVNVMFDAARGLIQAMPQVFDVLKTFLENTVEKNDKWYMERECVYRNKTRYGVLAHGDLWAPQILWKDENTIGTTVDWQLTQIGSPVKDLFRILTTCTSVANRKKLQKPLLDHYHKALSEKLEKDGVKMPFTREELDEEVKFHLGEACMSTVFANGFWANSQVLKNPDGTPNMEKMMESFSRCRSLVEDALEAYGFSS